MTTRVQITVRGIVQGVGFRPYVFALARQYALTGLVHNTTTGVLIDVEGESLSIAQFINALRTQPPPLARLESLEWCDDLELVSYRDFRIVESAAAGDKAVAISPDMATCQDCLKELFNPTDRRYRYPFVNCTNCGPRFTIIQEIPYDRARTTMRAFAMCAACAEEYHDPGNRRFHAQPNACPACGPQVSLVDAAGQPIAAAEPDALRATLHCLAQGAIIAIKGLGGFHLACDALQERAVTALRQRKYREDKPFALMARDLAMIQDYCDVNAAAASLLLSPQRPIVLLRRRADCRLPDVVAPQQQYLGCMLPYTPLHHLLLLESAQPLVMTSGNVSDEPIAYQDDDARQRLGSIADVFLLHNRAIHMRCDDSVMQLSRGRAYPIRRSRGYAPAPLRLALDTARDILACGAELKNTFCLIHHNLAFISHHIGDLENLETLRAFTQGIEHVKTLWSLQPEIIAYDLHPEYLSTKYALALDDGAQKVGVQHHHAHVVSCMVDNHLDGEVMGVALDGLGYGSDGHLWGSEFLLASWEDFTRACHLAYAPMPGGVQAIKEPWRMAAVYLHQTFGDDFLALDIPFVQRLNRRVWQALQRMLSQGINSPLSSGMGRLFDAVSSLLGLRDTVHYEGQAAIALEMLADPACCDSYHFELEAQGRMISVAPVLTGMVQDLQAHVPTPVIAAKFHQAVAEMIARVATRLRRQEGLRRVVLSGGVWQNQLLREWTWQRLEAAGFDVYMHHQVPTNDAGISLGQAVVAAARIKAGKG